MVKQYELCFRKYGLVHNSKLWRKKLCMTRSHLTFATANQYYLMIIWAYIKQVLTINEQRRLIDEDLPMLEDGDMFVADREVIVVEKDDDGDGEVERKEITVEQ